MKLSEKATAIATAFTLAAIATAGAQVQPQPSQQPPDSVVAVVADAQGLPYVPPGQCPVFGTFWEVRSSLPCITAPLPFPPLDPATPVYAIGDPVIGGQFLVDLTAGQVVSPQTQYSRRALSSMSTASIVQAQAEELQTFIAQVQARQASAQARANGQMSPLSDGPPTPGEGGGGTNGWEGGGTTFDAKFYTTNDLWLEIVTLTNATGFFIVHPPEAEAATGVYDLFMTTNLSPNVPGLNLTNWLWLLRTDPGETNLIVPGLWADQAYFMLGRTNDTDGDGMSDAYEHLVSHTSPTNQDGPIITLQPLSQTVYSGDTVTFTVAAEGAQPLAYQWFLNASALPGETNTSLTLANVQTSQGGDYSVQVTSPLSLSVLSSNASLSVPLSEYGDFIWLIGPRQDFTFRNGVTYLVNSRVELYGVTTIQGGSVIKPDWYYTNSTVVVMGTLLCKTDDPNLPAFFTSVDDDSLGQMIDISTGYPETAANGCPYLDLSAAQVSNSGLSNLRVWYADQGITTPDASKRLDLWHCQFLECNAPIQAGQGAAAGFHNVLFGACTTAVAASTNFAGIMAEQITAEVSTLWTAPAPPAWLRLTNSIITGGIASGPALATDHVAISPAGPIFQTNGSANYYLANASPLRAAGTPAISARLQTELRQKTTHPPLAFPQQMQAAGELTLSQQAGRYTSGAPDYGYYYQALDYTVAWMKLRGKITVLPGTTIGFRQEPLPGTYYTTAYGFDLKEGSTFVSRGTPTKPITLVDVQFIQEQPTTPCLLLFAPDFTPPNLSGTDDAPPSLDFRFSNFYTVRGNYVLWSGVSEQGWYSEASLDSAMYWSMQDCNIRGGNITIGLPDWYWMPWDYLYGDGSVSWVNNLFDQVGVFLDPTYYPNGYNDLGLNVDMAFSAYNNLFRGGGWFHLEPIPASAGNWVFQDNLFEKVHFVQNIDMPLDFDHNAYWPLTQSDLSAWGWGTNRLLAATNGSGTGEQLLDVAPPYQSGPLGDYYLPATTPLYHAGSRLATDAGLFHFTTRVDQTKEGSGQAVSIGLHYVAVTNGAPKDSDGDGIPDYLENWHGDANFASHTDSETDWQTQYTTSGVFDPTNSVYDDIDLSGNGLVGRVKKAFGMAPFDASNPLTLTQATVATDPGTVTFQLPISYGLIDHTSSNSVGKVDLLMDGTPLSVGCEPGTNGLSLLHWEVNFSPPGFHMLQAQFILSHILTSGPDPDPTVITAPGIPIAYTADTGIQFDPFYSQFDDAHGAVLYAATPTCPDATYSIELQTTNGTHIKTIDGTTSNGEISEPWDLTDDQGHTITNDSVNAVFNVTLLDPGSYTATFNLNRVADRYLPVDGAFTIAYGADHVADEQDLHDCLQLTVVDQLIGPCNATFCYDHPYTSTFNAWSALGTIPGNPGHLAYQSDCDALLSNLANTSIFGDLTKNFYYFGHASPNNLGTKDYLFFNTKDVADRLENHDFTYYGPGRHTPGKHRFGQAYRLVFLDGCATAMDADWAHAFGVYDRITTKQLASWPEQVQAFVGWDNLKKAPGSGNNFNMANCYSVFWSAWQSGLPLDRCIWFASQDHPPAPLNFMDLSNYNFGPRYQHWNAYYRWKYGLTGDARIKLYGYAGITRTGYVPGYDNSPYHK